MGKYLNLYFVIAALLGLISCHRQITCPKFDEKTLSWIPYQENDVIELYSPTNDSTITFSVKSVEIRHTTHYNTGYDCGTCDDVIEVNQNSHDNSKFHINITLNKNKITYQSYWISDTYFVDGNYTYMELTNFTFGDKQYDVVRIFEKNDSNGTIKKLIIAKEIGIVGLIDIEGNTWTLIDSTSKDRSRNAKIKNISCD